MEAALEFYCEKLGFVNAEWGGDDFTLISRDGASIYLCLQDQGAGHAWAWIGVEDAARLHEEFLRHDVPIRMLPTNYPWALELHVEDPFGNVLRFGSEPLT